MIIQIIMIMIMIKILCNRNNHISVSHSNKLKLRSIIHYIHIALYIIICPPYGHAIYI